MLLREIVSGGISSYEGMTPTWASFLSPSLLAFGPGLGQKLSATQLTRRDQSRLEPPANGGRFPVCAEEGTSQPGRK